MTNQQKEELAHLKSEATKAKTILSELVRDIEKISPAQARSLGLIVGRLEHWQHTGGLRRRRES